MSTPTAASCLDGQPKATRIPGCRSGSVLWDGYRRGAPLREFERLYGAHARQLLAFLIYRTGDRALSEDLLGDTFERVLRAKRLFDPRRGSEKTWLYAIALNCLRDHARRQSAEKRALERIGGPAEEWGPVDTESVHDRDVVRRTSSSSPMTSGSLSPCASARI